MPFGDVLSFRHVTGGDTVEVGPIALTFFPSVHTVPTVSVRAEAEGRVLAYSADSAGGPDLEACARSADLFLCEATWQGTAADHVAGLHLTASDAAALAARAGVGRLLLTHLWPTLDRARSREEAAAEFEGSLDLAEDQAVWAVA